MASQHPITVQHRETDGRGMFYVPGNRAGQDFCAAMMYHRYEHGSIVNVDHTEVDDSLRGQGVGKRLLTALVEWARGEGGVKVSATCPFAVAMFERDPSLGEGLLVDYAEA